MDRSKTYFRCLSCNRKLKRAKVLPCQHTFCSHCLDDLYIRRNRIRCPECRFKHEVPSKGLSGFQTLTIPTVDFERGKGRVVIKSVIREVTTKKEKTRTTVDEFSYDKRPVVGYKEVERRTSGLPELFRKSDRSRTTVEFLKQRSFQKRNLDYPEWFSNRVPIRSTYQELLPRRRTDWQRNDLLADNYAVTEPRVMEYKPYTKQRNETSGAVTQNIIIGNAFFAPNTQIEHNDINGQMNVPQSRQHYPEIQNVSALQSPQRRNVNGHYNRYKFLI